MQENRETTVLFIWKVENKLKNHLTSELEQLSNVTLIFPDDISPENLIKLASNENTLGPSSQALKALRDFLPKIYLYPEDSCFYLKKELAKKLKVKRENLILGNGSDEIMELISKTFLNPGEEVIYGHPSFLI